MRRNLLRKLAGEGSRCSPGVLGYEDTVVPQVVNAVLSRHNMILLGLRGQAKSRLLRSLTDLLDPVVPAVAGCEIHDDPCRRCAALPRPDRRARRRDAARLADARASATSRSWPRRTSRSPTSSATWTRSARRAAARPRRASSRCTTACCRARTAASSRSTSCPTCAGRIQVGLFNILQEGDVQIKGYPVRLPLDVCMVFTANPEDYTARGKIITPLKDRIGSEIRTHYPATLEQGVAITQQEAWTEPRPGPAHAALGARGGGGRSRSRRAATRGSTSAAASSQRLPISALENAV